MHSDRQHARQMPVRATVSGSFQRHLGAVAQTHRELQQLGAVVLSPRGSSTVGRRKGFVYLEGDIGSIQDIELRHLAAIAASDFLYVADPEGYIGSSTAAEIGWALAHGVPVWAAEMPADGVFGALVSVGSTRDATEAALKSGGPTVTHPFQGLSQLQAYYARVARKRGFADETLAETLILLMEEVGELAKAIRNRMGLTVHLEFSTPHEIAPELADCLLYIVHLANISKIALSDAVAEKERLNEQRNWVRSTRSEESIQAPVERETHDS